MKREQVNIKDKWKLEDIYASDADWERDYERLQNLASSPLEFRGKLGDKNSLIACLTCLDELNEGVDKLYAYAHMRCDEDVSDDKYSAMRDKAMSLYVEIVADTAFINPELTRLDERVLSAFAADEELKIWAYMLRRVIKSREHVLSEESEKILAMASDSFGYFRNTFSVINNVELPMPKVKNEQGKELRLTHGLYSQLLSCRDRAVRKGAFEGLYGAVKSLLKTIASNYIGSVKHDNFYAKAYKFSSPLERAMFDDDVPSEVYDNLIKSVSANLSCVHDYVRYRKEMLGGKLNMYDMYVSLVPDADLSLGFEDAFELVKEGLKPLGKEYAELLCRARKERWIDVYETENKRSGGYQSGCYAAHPYILLNYSKTAHDVFTLAHELGHAMHTHYSNSALPYTQSGYSIFVAEVASTVNEVLLLKHLLKATEDKNMRKYLLSYYLDMLRTTLFRQTMFAEFERKVHETDLSGVPLTSELLSDTYYELNKKYYGDGVTHDDEIRYEWARIPHFYTAFYVYKYATGITSAVGIADDILRDGKNVDNYKKFLSAGGTDSPYEILKIAGVDLKKQAPYDKVMKEFAITLDELKKL